MKFYALCLLFLSVQLSAQSELGENKRSSTLNIEYLISLPADYSKSGQGSPLLLFLHGGDGSNTKHHPKKYAVQAGIDFRFMVVAPQCSRGCNWSSLDFDTLLKEVTDSYNVDKDRIYVTGYSYGGYGTWSAVSKFPQWFAAAVPIAGGGDINTVCNAKDVAIKAFHGDKDSITPYSGSKKLISTLKTCGANAQLETIVNGDHWIWPAIYKDSDFYRWLLEHSKK